MIPWPMEKQCSVRYTHEVFSKFQEQLVVARDHCIVQGIEECEDIKIFTISSLSGKERVVQMNKTNMFATCSCKLYESYGIPCRHIIQVLHAEKQNEVPSNYIMKRWKTRCKRCVLYVFSFGSFVSFCTAPFLFYTISLNEHFNFIGNYSMMMKITY